MSRFILRYSGKGPKPAEDVARIRKQPRIEIVDETPRMLLVEAPEEAVRAACKPLADWVITAESTGIPLPEPHPGVPKLKRG